MTIRDKDGVLVLGDSSVNENNITIKTPGVANGSLEFYKGTPDALGDKIFSVDSTGTDLAKDLSSTEAYKGAALVGFKQTGVGAVDRTLQDKAREWVSVKDFGAVGDGVTDDTAAIQAALSSGATTVDATNITCKVSSALIVKTNVKFIFDTLIPANSTSNIITIYGGASVSGKIDVSEFADYSATAVTVDGNAENLGYYFRLNTRTLLDLVLIASGYTGTAIKFNTETTSGIIKSWIMGVDVRARISKFENGVWLDKKGTDLNKFITSNYFHIDSSECLIPFRMDNEHPNGYGISGNHTLIKHQPPDPTIKPVSGPAIKVCGQRNYFDIFAWDWHTVFSYYPYAIELESNTAETHIIWHNEARFVDNKSSNNTVTFFYKYESIYDLNKVYAKEITIPYNTYYKINSYDSIATPVLGLTRFSLSLIGESKTGFNILYDTNNTTGIHAFKCNGVNKFFISNNGVTPAEDNSLYLGSLASRWSTIYAGTGTINTSDEREKTFGSIEEAETQVALELKSMIRKFKFNDAIEKKGENARWHFGVGAQSVSAVFEKYKLDPADYALFCYDEWDELPEVKDEDGNVTQEYRPAGNRYGVRYEELLAFIISAL